MLSYSYTFKIYKLTMDLECLWNVIYVTNLNWTWTTTVLERPSSQMSYLDHFLKETGGSNTSTHTASTLAANMVSYGVVVKCTTTGYDANMGFNDTFSWISSHNTLIVKHYVFCWMRMKRWKYYSLNFVHISIPSLGGTSTLLLWSLLHMKRKF